MGSGSTAIAALRTPGTTGLRHRRPAYEYGPETVSRPSESTSAGGTAARPSGSTSPPSPPRMPMRISRRVRSEKADSPRTSPSSSSRSCGFENIHAGVQAPRAWIELNYIATDKSGEDWAFDVSGAFTSNRSGLMRTDTLWKALGKAAVLSQAEQQIPLVLLTTDVPQERQRRLHGSQRRVGSQQAGVRPDRDSRSRGPGTPQELRRARA